MSAVMTKRRREVYDNDMVAHIWANQSQASARNGGANNFFFEGDTIYSYGHHFPIARIVKLKQSWQSGGGERQCVLFTRRRYSVTTSCHCSIARQAIPNDMTVYEVDDVTASGKHPAHHKRNIENYQWRIDEAAKKLRKARSTLQYIGEIASTVEEANSYCKFFGLKKRFSRPDGFDYKSLEEKGRQYSEQAEANRERRYAARRENYRRSEEERQIKSAEHLEAWLSGADFFDGPTFYSRDPVYLRVKKLKVTDALTVGHEEVLETSMGAEVPLDHAKRAFAFIAKCKAEGTTYQRNGHSIHVGHFVIDSIDAEGNVKAGCHDIKWSEIERIARQLGIYDESKMIEDALQAGLSTN